MCKNCKTDCGGCDTSTSTCYNPCAPKCDPCKKQIKLYYCGEDVECLDISRGDDLQKVLEVYGETICQIREDASTGTHVEVIEVEEGELCENGGVSINVVEDVTGIIVSSNTLCNTLGNFVESVTGNIVDNSDPQNPVINLDFDTCCFEEVTILEANTLINNSELIEGTTYKITGVDPTLYDDGTTAGTTIFLKALTKNKLSTNGHGIFYNPLYNQAVSGFGIYSNYMRGTLSNKVGDFNIWGEDVVADNGATGKLYGGWLIKYTSGDWSSATSITGMINASTADISGFQNISYAVGENVIWGGYVWENKNGLVGAESNLYNLNSEWEKIPYAGNYEGAGKKYNRVLDIIEYDIENDIITRRYDSKNSIDVVFDITARKYFMFLNGISSTQWGNNGSYPKDVLGVRRIFITNSYVETVNFRGRSLYNLTFKNNSSQREVLFLGDSRQQDLNFDNSSYQRHLIFDNYSFQVDVSFDKDSYQQYLVFNKSSQSMLMFDNRSFQQHLILIDGCMQESLTFSNASYQSNVDMNGRSWQTFLDFSNNSNQLNLTLEGGKQGHLILKNESSQIGLTLTNNSQQIGNELSFLNLDFQGIAYTAKNIRQLSGVGKGSTGVILVPDLTSATNIFDNTLVKSIVITPSVGARIKFLDDTLTYQFVNLDS